MAKIELTNSIFDRDNDNVLKFNNKGERDDYFNALQDKVTFENVNFNAGDLINTQIELNVNGFFSLFRLLNYNYCIVTQEDEKLFYFIEKSEQLDGSLISLQLTCDLFQTYFYDIENLQGLITRTHLDRFIKNGELWKYNNQLDSPLFEKEGMEFAKRPIALKKLKQIFKGNALSIGEWLNENVIAWKYVFVDAQDYSVFTGTNTLEKYPIEPMRILTNGETWNGINSNLAVIVIPIYRDEAKQIKIKARNSSSSEIFFWNDFSLDYFLSLQGEGYARVKAIKYSPVCPFCSNEFKYIHSKLYIDETGNLTIDPDAYIGFPKVDQYVGDNAVVVDYRTIIEFFGVGTETEIISACAFLKIQNPNEVFLSIDSELLQFEFEKNEITNSSEPKILNEEVSEYRLFLGGNLQKMPILKTSNRPIFKYIEPFTPDITKAMLIYDDLASNGNLNNGVYTEINLKDFSGFTIQIDLSQWFVTDQLDLFLANNKNNLQIFANTKKMEQEQLKVSAVGTGLNSLMNPQTAGSQVVNLFSSAVNLGIKQASEVANYKLTLDNMASSVDNLSAVNSNIALISAVNELGLYIEVLKPIPFEQEIFIDKMKMLGYTYGKIGNVNNFVNSRKFYNYVEAVIYEINGNFAEQVKDGLKEIFAKGVRMWHSDNWTGEIDYNLNNIERSVLNG